MTRYLFVGERQSPTARRRGWTWRSGRLAAKQLFDALSALDLSPRAHRYCNLFVPHADRVCPRALGRVRAAAREGLAVVGMGRKVQFALAAVGLPHYAIPHPAARGAVRAKARYAAAVATGLRITGYPLGGLSGDGSEDRVPPEAAFERPGPHADRD